MGNIRRVRDAAGRITSFTLDGNSNLVRMVTPELCTTSMI
jgi:YD repeat-containing protein